MQHTLFKYLSYHIVLFLNLLGYRSSMNNMEEIVKFTENHQKQEVTVLEPTDEMSEKLFKYLHKSDVRIMSVAVDC
jgi:demethoxyubiquinone hydroxylase (CLK1/Coq7/Cat5 family)